MAQNRWVNYFERNVPVSRNTKKKKLKERKDELRDLAGSVKTERDGLYDDTSERQPQFDSFGRGLESWGIICTELLRNYYRDPHLPPIPAWLAGLMLVSSKLERASRSSHAHPDHYADMVNYVEKAYDLDLEKRPNHAILDEGTNSRHDK